MKIIIIFCLLVFYLAKCQDINEYLYAIEKIYWEEMFIDRSLYTVEDIKGFFNKKVNLEKQLNKNINYDDYFKETVFKFVFDPYLKIEKKDLFESSYYRDASPSEDIKVEKLTYEFFGQKINICYLSYQKISPNMAKKYKEYLKKFIEEDDVVIIDLTNNSGGSLWSAAYFISFFFEKNTYLFSVNFLGRDKIKTQNFITSEDRPFLRNIVFVVQDDTTISSAEVISGVLKQKSLVFGDLSYGKPYIQSTLEVGNLIVTFTNAFLNFDLELKPHDKIKPDFFLSPKEIENKKIIEIASKMVYYLRIQSFGG